VSKFYYCYNVQLYEKYPVEVNMARGARVSEDKIQTMIENWKTKDTSELAKMLGVGDSTVSYWAGKLRKSMKAHGMTSDQIKEVLPVKRKAQGSVFDNVVIKMLASTKTAPKQMGRKPRKA
jgi:transposase